MTNKISLTVDSLQGLRVLVTRPVLQAHSLVKSLRQYNGHIVELPTIEIVPIKPGPHICRIIQNLDQYQKVIFISVNAARIGSELFLDYWPQWPAGINWLAVGNATAKGMSDYGLNALVPDAQDSEGMLTLRQFNAVKGEKILIVKGLGGRTHLSDTLLERGAVVESAEVYRRQIPTYKHGEILSTISPEKIDIVLISSVESLDNFCSLVSDNLTHWLKIPLLVVSDRIARTAENAGFGRLGVGSIVVSDGASDGAILSALQRYVNRRPEN